MFKDKEKFAVWVTKEAKDTTFVDCDIEGLKNEGERTRLFETKIFNFRKKHPTIWKSIIITLIPGLLIGLILLEIEYQFFIS